MNREELNKRISNKDEKLKEQEQIINANKGVIEELEKSLKEKVGKFAMDYICQGLDIHYQQRLEKLKTEIEAEKAVVDFYGNSSKWDLNRFEPDVDDIEDFNIANCKIVFAGGKLARQRIKERNNL